QSVRALADALVKLTVTDVFRTFRIISLPDDRGFVAAGFQVAIQTIARNVERSVVEPADVAIALCKVRVFDPREFLNPIDATTDTTPEALWILNGLRIHSLVVNSFDLSRVCKALGNWV